jgi:hypothetical protein
MSALLGCVYEHVRERWLARTPYQGWLFPVLVVFLGLHLLLLLKKLPEKGYGPWDRSGI